LLAHPDDPGGWLLTAEGGAIHLRERTAVVADVHLGYEWARASGGDMVPPHSLRETIARLEWMLARAPVDRLIVAGDLVETAAPCPRTSADVRALSSWLGDRGLELVRIRGNHDAPTRPALPSTCVLDGWTIAHGDRPFAAARRIVGHHHPALRAEGVNAPCFLVGPDLIALPAFSPNAAGLNVASGTLPPPLAADLRCVAGLDGLLLDFGPLARLAGRLGRA
jgi:putative SbcD/Mre11-related phosphoesterase